MSALQSEALRTPEHIRVVFLGTIHQCTAVAPADDAERASTIGFTAACGITNVSDNWACDRPEGAGFSFARGSKWSSWEQFPVCRWCQAGAEHRL